MTDVATAAVVGGLFINGGLKHARLKAFVEAAERGRPDICLPLVRRHGSLADESFRDTPIMHWAVRCGSAELVRLMIEEGADVNAKEHYRQTPLHWACMPREFKDARYMLTDSHKVPESMTPLPEQGNVQTILALLECGADINARDSRGWTPLHWVTIAGFDSLARLLVERGADILIQDEGHMAPLPTAAYHGKKQIVRLLLDQGADLAGGGCGGTTPLHWAATREIAELLVERGASIEDARETGGRTPLHFAVSFNRPEVARFLIEKGADTQALDRRKKRPIDHDHMKRLEGTDLGRMLRGETEN